MKKLFILFLALAAVWFFTSGAYARCPAHGTGSGRNTMEDWLDRQRTCSRQSIGHKVPSKTQEESCICEEYNIYNESGQVTGQAHRWIKYTGPTDWCIEGNSKSTDRTVRITGHEMGNERECWVKRCPATLFFVMKDNVDEVNWNKCDPCPTGTEARNSHDLTCRNGCPREGCAHCVRHRGACIPLCRSSTEQPDPTIMIINNS
ncbi:MAG: hypothetical protein FWE17_02905 [Alphaproteobacteria bacterium]|nr:hypothetical protein [Alphaproteobacteria bacterium]MCL2757980.1 hypothetical protein [Alphaproteobacteria bacterium]